MAMTQTVVPVYSPDPMFSGTLLDDLIALIYKSQRACTHTDFHIHI